MDIKTSAQKNLFFSRKVKFNFSVEYQKNWFSNNSFLSHFMDTLSISIEKVEPYLNQCVLYYINEAKEFGFEDIIYEFIKQEGTHTFQHHQYNLNLMRAGYNVKDIQSKVDARIKKFNMNSPIDKLAIAVAMELFTESISDWWLRNGNYKKDQNVFTEVWSWHCVEELEHRDVLYDFYIKLGGRKKRLSLYLIIFLIPTFVIFYKRTLTMLKKDNRITSIFSVEAIKLMFLRNGLFPTIFANV